MKVFSQMKNDVVVVVTNMGEVIGRLQKETEDYVVLSMPRLFIQTGEQAGFVPGVSACGQENPSEGTFFKSSVVTICHAREEIASAWSQQTSGIVL